MYSLCLNIKVIAMVNKKYWIRSEIMGCNNRLWINGDSGAVYRSIDKKRWMWRNNIVNANSINDAENTMRLLDLCPTKQNRMFLCLMKK